MFLLVNLRFSSIRYEKDANKWSAITTYVKNNDLSRDPAKQKFVAEQIQSLIAAAIRHGDTSFVAEVARLKLAYHQLS